MYDDVVVGGNVSLLVEGDSTRKNITVITCTSFIDSTRRRLKRFDHSLLGNYGNNKSKALAGRERQACFRPMLHRAKTGDT